MPGPNPDRQTPGGHIHATEYDRSGENINEQVAAIERAGLLAADLVVAVSRLTRKTVIERYGVPPEKVVVVYNAVARHEVERRYEIPPRIRHEKRVLFLGRVTFQKGPEYFMEAARLVLQKIPNARFFMAGSGDMLPQLIRRAGQLRIGHRFHFAGFLRGEQVDRMFALSDLYVMPSVSEPFGITPLEAMLYDVPVLLSRQSGVSEVLEHALKADFWGHPRHGRQNLRGSALPLPGCGIGKKLPGRNEIHPLGKCRGSTDGRLPQRIRR